MISEALDYIALAAIPGGLGLAVWGIRWATRHLRRQLRDPWRALVLMQAFRIVLIGLCLTALGAGLWWREGAVIGLAAIIFGEEMLESGVFLAALRSDVARRSPRTLEPALPANSYVRPFCHSRESGNPVVSTCCVCRMDPRLRGDDGIRNWRAKPLEPLNPIF